MKAPKSWYKFKNKESEKCHFISELIDSGSSLVVFKWWRKSKQRWQYEVESKAILKMFHWE